MTSLLILTVGTGTAGRFSDLASGLLRTIELLSPRQFWLIPSTSPDSLAIADLLAENQPAFAGRFPLEHPDDLEDSRKHIRNVIIQARNNIRGDERLLINPTSGTKQMTVAATLAALDEQIGDIVFTTGERADGVVKTGTESITAFNPASYFLDRDLQLARQFFNAGDFFAAERVLKPHNTTLTKEWTTAFTCHHWRRFDYDHAKAYCAILANRTPQDIVADILAWSEHALRHDDPDGSIRLTYKALEQAARFFLKEQTGLEPDDKGLYKAADIAGLKTTFVPESKKNTITLGLQNIVKILKDMGHPFGSGFDYKLFSLSNIRNEATHDLRPVMSQEAQSYLDRTLNLIDIKPTVLPSAI